MKRILSIIFGATLIVISISVSTKEAGNTINVNLGIEEEHKVSVVMNALNNLSQSELLSNSNTNFICTNH